MSPAGHQSIADTAMRRASQAKLHRLRATAARSTRCRKRQTDSYSERSRMRESPVAAAPRRKHHRHAVTSERGDEHLGLGQERQPNAQAAEQCPHGTTRPFNLSCRDHGRQSEQHAVCDFVWMGRSNEVVVADFDQLPETARDHSRSDRRARLQPATRNRSAGGATAQESTPTSPCWPKQVFQVQRRTLGEKAALQWGLRGTIEPSGFRSSNSRSPSASSATWHVIKFTTEVDHNVGPTSPCPRQQRRERRSESRCVKPWGQGRTASHTLPRVTGHQLIRHFSEYPARLVELIYYAARCG